MCLIHVIQVLLCSHCGSHIDRLIGATVFGFFSLSSYNIRTRKKRSLNGGCVVEDLTFYKKVNEESEI